VIRARKLVGSAPDGEDWYANLLWSFGGLEPAEVVPAKTADRSVLGCMNDVAFMCEVAITHSGGLARTDIAELNQALRRNINSVRDYQPPIELTAQRPRASR